jgi:hypothetical protein
LGKNNFLLRPDPALTTQPVVEELSPFRTRSLLKGGNVVTHLEKAAALRASIEDFLQRISDTAPGKALKPRS